MRSGRLAARKQPPSSAAVEKVHAAARTQHSEKNERCEGRFHGKQGQPIPSSLRLCLLACFPDLPFHLSSKLLAAVKEIPNNAFLLSTLFSQQPILISEKH